MSENQFRYYVYSLSDPRTGGIFYLGKGCGKRVSSHVKEVKAGKVSNVSKYKRIKEILDLGLVVQESIIEDGLSEQAAFKMERELILGMKDRLSNIVHGVMTNDELIVLRVEIILKKVRPYNEWLRVVNDEIVDYAVKHYGSLIAFYDSFIDQLKEIAARASRNLNHKAV